MLHSLEISIISLLTYIINTHFDINPLRFWGVHNLCWNFFGQVQIRCVCVCFFLLINTSHQILRCQLKSVTTATKKKKQKNRRAHNQITIHTEFKRKESTYSKNLAINCHIASHTNKWHSIWIKAPPPPQPQPQPALNCVVAVCLRVCVHLNYDLNAVIAF